MNIAQILSNFPLEGDVLSVKVLNKGHINSSFQVTCQSGKYTLQKINKSVFLEPDKVMENIVIVTKRIKAKTEGLFEPDKRSLEVVFAKDGKPFLLNEDGEYWRLYKFIDDVDIFDKLFSPALAYSLGKAVGEFQARLSDLDISSLNETIWHFHDMGMRYSQLEETVKNNPKDRVKDVRAELEFLLENKERGCLLWNEYESGSLPARVTHNDAKINNVLFSKATGEALCLIDLDTVMPGSALFDAGDMIRTGCSTAEEDEKDLFKVEFDLKMYNKLKEGYFEAADSFLTEREKALFKESGRTITQIMAVRFLTDYLNGDIYYHTDYDDHNLVRARNQLKLIRSMDERWSLF